MWNRKRQEKTSPYELKRMSRSDVSEVLEIEKASFSEPWPAEVFKNDLSSDRVCQLVAKEGDQVVGYLVAFIRGPEFHIANVAVRSEHRRLGIGKSLLSQALKDGKEKNCTTAVLDVRESNLGAIRLYSSFGFELAGRRPHYYRLPPEDALVMSRPL